MDEDISYQRRRYEPHSRRENVRGRERGSLDTKGREGEEGFFCLGVSFGSLWRLLRCGVKD